MGSQTLEILRQGFWASITGGWFFDPRQAIFCNTFHMYLWMYLLLLPFITFLTTGESSISIILYPAMIFITFFVIKIANSKLHCMFDGEEVNEVEEECKNKTVEEATACLPGEESSDRENKKVDQIELDVLHASQLGDGETNQVSDKCDSSSSLHQSSKSMTIDVTNGELMGDSQDVSCNHTSNEKSSSLSSSSTSSLSSTGGRAELVVVDVHNNIERPESRSPPTAKLLQETSFIENEHEDVAALPSYRHQVTVEDDRVFAVEEKLSNKMAKLSKIPSLDKQEGQTNDEGATTNNEGAIANDGSETEISEREKAGAENNDWQLIACDVSNEALSPQNAQLPNENIQNTQLLSKSSCDEMAVKCSDDALPQKKSIYHGSQNSVDFVSANRIDMTECISDMNIKNGETQEKAMSLSTLMSSSASHQGLNMSGKRTKNNQGVWFSLPEMESVSSTRKNDINYDDSAGHIADDGNNGIERSARSHGIEYSTENHSDCDGNAASTRTSSDHSHTSVHLKLLNDVNPDDLGDIKERIETMNDLEANHDSVEANQDSAEQLTYERRRLHRRGATRQSFRDVVRERGPLRQRRHRLAIESAGSSLLGQDDDVADHSQPSVRHVAMSHEDTSAGAVHCFKDEFGIWHTYVFGDEGTELDAVQHHTTADHSIGSSALLRDLLRTSSRRGAESVSTPASLADRDLFESVYQDMRLSQLLSGGLESRTSTGLSQFASPGSLKTSEPPPRRYYKLFLNESFFIKIWLDRLALLALLDRNKSNLEAVVAVVLATLTAYLGYLLLSCDNIYDIWVFILCFVIAKCQFSLLKSVQPDSASPVHGHNNVIVFSRAAYFCIVASLILLTDKAIKMNPSSPTLYGVHVYSKQTLEFAKDALIIFLLAFPVVFMFGLLPQINTFIMYFMEQIDVHIFGGTSMTSMAASFYSVFRSFLSTGFLYGFCFAAMKTDSQEQHILFSIYCGLLVAFSYHLSRYASDPAVMWEIFKSKILRMEIIDEEGDPLPEKLRKTVQKRLGNDIIISAGIIIVVFAVHVSTMFTLLQPSITYVLFALTALTGVANHYLTPQLRKELPWLIGSSPVLKSAEYDLFEARDAARVMWFERIYVWLCAIERNVLYPLTFINCTTRYARHISSKFGPTYGPLIITISTMKLLRSNFTSVARQHIVLIWTVLFFEFDYSHSSETFPIDYFVMSIFVDKAIDLLLKLRFILTYIAPWQITWGSAFHAFAQPFSIPHCGLLFFQAIVSAFLSAPLNPFLGSALFITSYVRPAKFWEKNYNTKRADHSNTRLSSHLDNNPCSDDNNLNSIFYEHLTRSLQHSLCGDLVTGRWGSVSSGDFFFIASDYLNALVHIIELGNGFVTFQLRGLEFRGTYCQQRELEAITELVDSDGGCCCCCSSSCTISRLLSCKAAFNQRWLAWEVIQTKYTLEGYSVSDNTATSMFQVFDLRKIFITYYVKAIIFYALKSTKLRAWMNDEAIMSSLSETRKPSFIDRDVVFRAMTDEDYDSRLNGVSRASFCNVYLIWIQYCNSQLNEPIEDCDKDSNIVLLCFALTLLGRRMFFTASHQPATTLKSFLHGLHALFKGDFRVSSSKDEWVFSDPDMELLRKVISPAVKMSVKLHQDHFTCPDEYDDNTVLYDAISSHDQNLVISHEGDPVWRQAVLNNKPSLLALRYVIDEGNDDYKIIMLNKRYLTFRVVKVNRECVRGLWAGQLQELIFLRNRNPERGSIQNAKQALRNMINSSCDQPIGYPIYVSPLTTSYVDTNEQITQIVGEPFSFNLLSRYATWIYERLAKRYGGACNPNSSTETDDSENVQPNVLPSFTYDSKVVAAPQLRSTSQRSSYTAVPNSSRRHSTGTSTVVVPSSLSRQVTYDFHKVSLLNSSLALDPSASSLKDLKWPAADLKDFANRDVSWKPPEGHEFEIVHKFERPRSDVKHYDDETESILLLRSNNKYLLIPESGVRYSPNLLI